MFTKTKFSRIAMAVALASSLPAYAADTTSGIRGVITGPNGQPATNTVITLIHQPSGTVTQVTTNETGSFNASGLRVGGPYQVTIDSDKFKDEEKGNIFLQLGQTFRLNEQLGEGDVEKITVTGTAALTSNSGSESYFDSENIVNSPTFNRDIKEVIRQNPLATTLGGDDNALSVAGQNPRYNSINVDGIGMNDDFGLNSNGYPTQRAPISVDALEQVSIETNPYNAEYGGFSGARVNAVTKSGTNEFHGGVFYERTDDAWTGKAKNPITGTESDLEGIDSDTFGFNVGGPLIKDKLFFFANYEKYKSPIVADWGPAGSGRPNETNLTIEQYEQVRDVAQSKYGIDIGGWDASPEEQDEKWLGKIDWNINDDHRASLTYQKVEGNSLRSLTSGEGTLVTSTGWYDYQQNMESYSFQLYSDWTSAFSTEVYASYKDVEALSGVETRDFGAISISGWDAYNDNTGISFGPDEYRHANELQTETTTLGVDADYLLGDHNLSFGVKYDKLDIFNLFVNPSLGAWNFSTFEDFVNGEAYEFDYTNAVTNDANDGAADFTMGTYAAYIQDEWFVNDAVELSLGLRYERTFADDTPNYNENFYNRYGFSNQENMDGLDIILPRLGFKWYATDDLVVRGGIGRFAGGRPNVWMSNSFSKDGITVAGINTVQGATFDSFNGVPQEYQDALTAGDGETNAVDPDFEMPSDWRTSLGFDYTFDIPSLGDGFLWTSEFIYVDKQDDLAWRDLNRVDTGERTSDGRVIWEQVDEDHTYDILLTNAEEDGNSKIFSTSLAKAWDNGLSMNVSYTYQDIEEGTPGTSSQSASNWKYDHIVSRNVTQLGTGYYEIEHSLKLSFNYKQEFIDGYATNFNVFFERRSGLPFSWLMGGAYRDANGNLPSAVQNAYAIGDENGIYGNYAPYIPSGPDDAAVAYADGLTYEQFMSDYVGPAGLTGYAGGYVPKMSDNVPWVTTMDVAIQQEIPGFVEDHKGTVYFTIRNFLNLLNDDWGQQESASNSYKTLINGNYQEDGTLVYRPYSGFETDNNFETEDSVWYLKIGVRYEF
ncbi:TonB-dependent receptor plug domain-containing protein [Alteromonas pelagimontana]|uniref:TonB-dependent receptor plug domain-containing protein n=1 Tax=Alteromonas pelagimontana TaxID=1858656 RepID=A0A6M4MFB6_9ALTE|nr:TonB-dependent receptor [Alteromonas pelagimontana]QJR81568.1 TonB-dependent receptor plug domain-containing protein [Alteromonas pelagimontana]